MEASASSVQGAKSSDSTSWQSTSAESQGDASEDDTFSDKERKLATDAKKFFQEGNLEGARRCLLSLNILRPQDISVKNNWLISQDEHSVLEFRALLTTYFMSRNIDSSVLTLNAVLAFQKSGLDQEIFDMFEALQPNLRALDNVILRDLLFVRMQCYIELNHSERVPKLIAEVKDLLSVIEATKKNGLAEAELEDKNLESPKQPNYQQIVKLFRVKCLLAIGSLRACRRELKNHDNDDQELTLLQSTFIRAHVEHLRDNGKKCIKILNTLRGQEGMNEPSVRMLVENSLACSEFKSGRISSAELHARKALKEFENLRLSGADVKSSTLGDILYNLAVCKMFTGEHRVAFRLLSKARMINSKDQHVWLRLAECAIICHHESTRSRSDFSDMVVGTVGKESYRRVLLKGADPEGDFDNSKPDEIEPTILFAERALRACRCVLKEVAVTLKQADLMYDGPPSVARFESAMKMKMSVEIGLTYVALCMGKYDEAIDRSKRILSSSEDKPAAHQTLVRLYLAEAYLMHGDFTAAYHELSLRREFSFDSSLPNDAESETQWKSQPHCPWLPRDAVEGKNVFLYNFAVAHILREDFRKAGDIVKELLAGSPAQPHVISLALYLKLQDGSTSEARSIVMEHLLGSSVT